MNTIEAITSRCSIRQFRSQEIGEDLIRIILHAGMSGPSCVNSKDWQFIVVRSHDTLEKMADANGKPAEPLRNAVLGILVCGDMNRAFKGAPDYWVIDGAIACQNMILAAQDLGIGSVWLGIWPQMERVNRQKELFNLPDHIIPHSIIAFGYPDCQPENRYVYDETIIHHEHW
ncbi:MAG: nitroreductase family protein [Bulleidia sp.]